MILGIDCAGSSGSIAIGDADSIRYAAQLNTGKTHSERIMPMVAHALESLAMRVKDLSAIAVTQGPGSFTGLRIGMSTAKGLAQGADLPFLAVPTLEVLAENGRFFDGLVCPVLNARRGEVYTALFRAEEGSLTRLTPDQALSLEALYEALRGQGKIYFCGDGLEAYEKNIKEHLAQQVIIPQGSARFIRSSALVLLAAKKWQEEGPDDLIQTGPIYLRQSEAVLRWQEANPGKSLES